MGRPRKEFHRLTRTLTVRVEDDQYDWLVERATDEWGDMSKAVRSALESARVMEQLLAADDPEAEFRALLERSEEEAAREEADLED
ncbi:MAG: hypothetical protein R6W48_09035 [Gaiellaceae bacterium]